MEQDAPLPPSIFIVGDRKQSIYGFRDADVGVLARAVVSIAGLRPDGSVRRAIRKSFRAVPALLAFTNDLFDAVEKAGSARRLRLRRVGSLPGGRGDACGGTRARPRGCCGCRRCCAERVASEIDALLASGQVRDKAERPRARACGPGDIGILFRSREGHQAFESALDARGIGSYVYKGLGFFEADEIKDVVRAAALPRGSRARTCAPRPSCARVSCGCRIAALQQLAPALADALA